MVLVGFVFSVVAVVVTSSDEHAVAQKPMKVTAPHVALPWRGKSPLSRNTSKSADNARPANGALECGLTLSGEVTRGRAVLTPGNGTDVAL